MNERRSPSVSPRAKKPAPAGPMFASSTAGWFAEWKARKASAEPSPPADTPPAAAAADASDAVARWLTGDGN
ncbi:hypothetical protein ETAA1_19060 [Urbifossiella limnaea]|uniref:Uncharacterized protein n=2 Tax=Urbifossiella limnaea TaxID=2528023 RepID=A0A517XR38_9BACT|nr:hypothetical protein ETAA1_19060 [Urbifossiella limnaea]